MPRMRALGLAGALLAGCATAPLPRYSLENGLPRDSRIRDGAPAAAELPGPVAEPLSYSFVEQATYQQGRGALESALASYTDLEVRGTGWKAQAAAKRSPGNAQEGLRFQAKPGLLAPVGVWADAYQDTDLRARSSGEGGRLNLDVPLGDGYVLLADGRRERNGSDSLTDTALGIARNSKHVLKVGNTVFNGESLPRAWAMTTQELRTGRDTVLVGAVNQAQDGAIYRLLLSEYSQAIGDGKDGFRVLGRWDPAHEAKDASVLYFFSATKPPCAGLMTDDRDNNAQEPRGDNGTLARWVARNPAEYFVSPLIEFDRRTRTGYVTASWHQDPALTEWRALAVAYPAGALGLDAAAANGFYLGLGGHLLDGAARDARALGEVGWQSELFGGSFFLNAEKEEGQPLLVTLRFQVDW